MDDVTPKMIIAAVVSLILLGLCIMIVGLITTTTGSASDGVETVTITDPNSDVPINIGYSDAEITHVQYYDSNGWHDVDTGNYTYVGNTVTIDHGVWS